MSWNIKKLFLPVILAVLLPACAPALVPQARAPGPPMQKAFHMHFVCWWNDPHVIQKLGLSTAQRKKMDQIFHNHRAKLEELHDNLHKQEAILGPLIGADQPNEGRILAQIDVVAQSRANLEKEFARMLLGIRRQLTPEQWQKLKVMYREHKERMHHGGHHPGPPPPSPPPQM